MSIKKLNTRSKSAFTWPCFSKTSAKLNAMYKLKNKFPKPINPGLINKTNKELYQPSNCSVPHNITQPNDVMDTKFNIGVPF